MLQKIIGQFTRDERLYNDEKIKNLAKRFPSENSPDGQRMIMYMLLFSWYTRNTVLPFTADQIVSLVDSIIDVYYNQEYQQMNNIMISLIRNDLQRMSFWSNEYVFKTFFNDDFITDADGRMYVNLEKMSVFNKWILQNPQNVEFYNYSHLLVQKCKHLQYVHNYTIMVSDDVPQNVVQIHCPKCDIISQISKDDFLKMCRNYEKSSAKFSQGISIYCHKCDTQINFIRLYGNFKVLYGGGDFQKQYNPKKQERFDLKLIEITKKCKVDDKDNTILKQNINVRQNSINNTQGEQAKWETLQDIFEQFGAIVKKNDRNWTYQKAQEWYNEQVVNVFNEFSVDTDESFIPDPQHQNVNDDDGLKEIFKYFAKERLEHMDMVYYSGQTFADRIKQEVDSEVIQLSGGTRQELVNLRDCLQLVQNKLSEGTLQFISDGINDKLTSSSYKLFKLFIDYKNTRKNDYHQTIYFVSNSGQTLTDYLKTVQLGKFKQLPTFMIPREQIQYISLCHGGIVIKIPFDDNTQIPFDNQSKILQLMIETINSLLYHRYYPQQIQQIQYRQDIQQVKEDMKRLVIFIAIMSKYEKAAYDNNEISNLTLRDDFQCFTWKNKQGSSHSFYKTFMQLYYGMLLWDGRDTKTIEVSPDNKGGNNKNTINTLKDTFIKFYESLKHNDNKDDVDNKLVYNVENEPTEKPLNDKYLSFLMTLYTYDCWIKDMYYEIYDISDIEEQKQNICKCVIEWIRRFVLYMLTKVYGYNEDNLKNVKKAFLIGKNINPDVQPCFLKENIIQDIMNNKKNQQ